MSRLGERWDAFWFAQGSPLTLAAFRIAFSFCLLLEVESSRLMSNAAILGDGAFHLRYSWLIPLLPIDLYQAAHHLQYLLIACVALGLATRLSCGVLAVVQAWILFADRQSFRNHPYFFILVLLLLSVSPSDAALSVKAWLRRGRSWAALLRPADAPLTAQRLLQFELSLVYAYAGVMKINADYLTGEVMAYHVLGAAAPDGGPPPGGAALWVGISVSTIALELFLAFALWLPRTRRWAMAVGIAFHFGIAVLMNIFTFSLAYVASYLLFLEPGGVQARADRWLVRREAAESPA